MRVTDVPEELSIKLLEEDPEKNADYLQARWQLMATYGNLWQLVFEIRIGDLFRSVGHWRQARQDGAINI